MKELGIPMDFRAKMITIDEVTLPVIASTICKNASTLGMQKLNESLAKESISTQDANKPATRTLDTKDQNADLQSIVKDNCKHLSAIPQRSYCSFSLTA
jgi:hypothetical protein